MRRVEIAEDVAFALEGVLAPSECAAIIEKAKASGFSEAPVNAGRDTDIRNNDRVLSDDSAWADAL